MTDNSLREKIAELMWNQHFVGLSMSKTWVGTDEKVKTHYRNCADAILALSAPLEAEIQALKEKLSQTDIGLVNANMEVDELRSALATEM